MLMGFGAVNVVEGLVDHQLLGFLMSMRVLLGSNGSVGMEDLLSRRLLCWRPGPCSSSKVNSKLPRAANTQRGSSLPE
jgi:hypothetical protein